MLFQGKYLFIESLYFNVSMTVFVGLMGGSSYVNVLHTIRELPTLTNNERECAMSLSLLFNDFGILCASTLSLILGLTWLKVDKVEN